MAGDGLDVGASDTSCLSAGESYLSKVSRTQEVAMHEEFEVRSMERIFENPEDLDSKRLLARIEAAFDGEEALTAARQHFLWSQELESVDIKQANLAMLQWKLVRNQTGILMQQLVEVRQQIERLMKDQSLMVENVHLQAVATKTSEERVKTFTMQQLEKLDQSTTRIRSELDAQMKSRNSIDIDVNRRLDQITEEMRAASVRGLPLEQEMHKLRADLQSQQAQSLALKECIQCSREEAKSGWDQMLQHHCQVKDALDRESRERVQALYDLRISLRGLCENERFERDSQIKNIHTIVKDLQIELDTRREELPSLRMKLQLFEDRLLDDCEKRTDKARFHDMEQKLTEMEGRVEYLSKSVSQEGAAREGMAEAFDQMLKSERAKTKGRIRQCADDARRDLEETSGNLRMQVEKERAERQTTSDTLLRQHSLHKQQLQEAILVIDGKLEGADAKYQALVQEVRNFRRLDGELLQRLRAELQDLQAATAADQAKRVEMESCLETHLEWIGASYDKVRDTFIQHGPRRRALLAKVGSPPTASPSLLSALSPLQSLDTSLVASPGEIL